MAQSKQASQVGNAVEIAVSLLLILGVIAWCLQIIAPFIGFVLWGAVIAISLHAPFVKLRNRLGNKLAITIFSVLGLGLVVIPSWLFGGSLFESTMQFYHAVERGSFEVPPPNESVQAWPLVGEELYAAWSTAAANFASFLTEYSEQLKPLASFAVQHVASLGVTVLLFIAAIVIAVAMLSNDERVRAGLLRLAERLMGKDGEEFLKLTSATVRSVTIGVLGIAFIQAVGTGLGMFLVDVPATGLWALLVLVLVVAQLPALIVMLPVIIYVFSVESTTVAVVFAIWSIAVSMSDVVLKPLLLGRGVPVPMLVILLGAIGGMMMSGILGLFVGAVVLAVGYKLFMMWLVMGEDKPSAKKKSARKKTAKKKTARRRTAKARA